VRVNMKMLLLAFGGAAGLAAGLTTLALTVTPSPEPQEGDREPPVCLDEGNPKRSDETRRELVARFRRIETEIGQRAGHPWAGVVPWDGRVYLVPRDELARFCNDVNQGDEPRRSVHGSFLLRSGDERKKVSGSPEIPATYQHFLLPGTVTARITEILESRMKP